MGAESGNWHLELTYDQWVALSVSGPRPLARYKHAAAVVDEKLYISGGSRNGRYLSDIQVFDLKTLAWSTMNLSTELNADKTKDSLPQEVLLSSSGHSMMKWGNKLLLVGGHSKNISDSATVRFIDLESYHSGVMETSGKLPVARGGQSVTMVGSRLIMFGGEDKHRKLLNDVHVLDLETLTWDVLETTQTPPAPRFDHTAALHAERYLLIFGGCSHSIFFNDFHVLDLQTMEWSQPQLQGDLVTPRAGHAGITIDENWYIVGGGDNRSGAAETLVLNMSKLVISVLTSVKGRDPLASEGLSVSSASVGGERILVTFGGYNGEYNNEVFVMRPKQKDSPHPKIFQSPAAAAAAASVTAAYALTKSGAFDFNRTEDSSLKMIQKNGSQHDLSIEINAIREEKKVLESALEDVRAENSSLKGKVDETASTYVDLSKELHSVQGQLVAERSRCAKLEAQIGELQKMLESLPSIEEEVQLLRSQKTALERDMELGAAVQRQSSGGVWKWIAG
ncbi:acyl-CoA-binding domain-containing protein 4-like [Actinidia eriantha]|uniref:acyl-CoA-binding domain-containing protein 4-like n=1 Tax=Actinidia eriantha TaxID=165200 RepID=UPI002583503B|nr:acyl-CoA-binding domain-containing protein 4-like [Actinidia eriantha]XP_057471624.1 acyl-CoA-binding domain-containing protein 4-like [Actinidia eriantha]XP_057471625.1 acyl-CoA-binding domain-containing protein 4-like [Actinidia eriantha]XP_057471626.1 acyl-CoA-binding domain-containing protein 4-like [Actinidia eriantha]